MSETDVPVQVNMHEAKSQLSRLGKLAWCGRRVVIARVGEPYLDLVPHREQPVSRRPGGFEGQIRFAEDFDETPPEVIADFEGDE
ncbi:MAG TPA: type II toxin-antitoxin system prevent-host-death family antitoxin [Gammaproteobacteria bacterium]|nr:type II toxin-antitoxin system prevent-host-death family antitoxin [Gammaproteobacteria bacterium]